MKFALNYLDALGIALYLMALYFAPVLTLVLTFSAFVFIWFFKRGD